MFAGEKNVWQQALFTAPTKFSPEFYIAGTFPAFVLAQKITKQQLIIHHCEIKKVIYASVPPPPPPGSQMMHLLSQKYENITAQTKSGVFFFFLRGWHCGSS